MPQFSSAWMRGKNEKRLEKVLEREKSEAMNVNILSAHPPKIIPDVCVGSLWPFTHLRKL